MSDPFDSPASFPDLRPQRSTFTLANGTPVAWGDATVEQHAERRQMFLNNAHANMEGAARHEVALRELRESGKRTLRAMIEVAA